MHERGTLRQSAGALLACVLLGFSPATLAGEPRDVARVVYEFAVTSYCGTMDAVVEAGYRAEVDAVTARSGLDAEAARRQRIRGWIAAEEEWRNRGLGGNRAWCAAEGMTAARHFRAIARGERQP